MKIFLFSQPTNCGKSRSLKLIISGNGFFFYILIENRPYQTTHLARAVFLFLKTEHGSSTNLQASSFYASS